MSIEEGKSKKIKEQRMHPLLSISFHIRLRQSG
jgi:hypothetical protein